MSSVVLLRANSGTSAMSIIISKCIVLNKLKQSIYIPLNKIHCIVGRTGVFNFRDSDETFSTFGDWEATVSRLGTGTSGFGFGD
jgi:hypothetical protein